MLRLLLSTIATFILLSLTGLLASEANLIPSSYEESTFAVEQFDTEANVLGSPASPADFAGNLRIYIVEPESRWMNYWGQPYHYGFLGFAVDVDVSLTGATSFDSTWQWTSPFSGITQENIMAIAVVSEQEESAGYSKPPSSNPFTAHFIVATAAATDGSPGSNESVGDYTHTEFIEEGTGTWCALCPYTAYSLDTLYHDLNGLGQIPFYYVAMIEDACNVAHDRLKDGLNLWAYPTCYFGGGYTVLVGGHGAEEPYRTMLDSAARREVFPLNLDVEVEFVNGNTLNLTVSVSAQVDTFCGDTDASGGVDLDDVIYLIHYIFGGGPEPVPYEIGDTDCSGGIDLDDVIFLIHYIFGGGPVPCAACP